MEAKLIEQIKNLSLEKRIRACMGKNAWETNELLPDIMPSIKVHDGPHGVRIPGESLLEMTARNDKSTCFPTSSALASTFNRELISEVAAAIAVECNHYDVDVLLGPGVNVKRSPIGGRNFEYYSEDPYLTAEVGISFINSLQENGVGACLKHYILNETEYIRLFVNIRIDKKTFYDIYIYPFKKIIEKAKPWTIMSSYNQVNGVEMSENKEFLVDVLRGELGFDGVVISDWGSVFDAAKSVKAGLDLIMPYIDESHYHNLLKALETGEIDEATINKSASVMGELALKVHNSKEKKAKLPTMDFERNHNIAVKAASESIVLLKNDNSILPISKGSKVTVIGEYATNPRIQGQGSSQINYYKLSSPLKELKAQGLNVTYVEDYHNISKALEAAESSDYIIIFAGTEDKCEVEGYDKESLDIDASHNKLINAIVEKHKNVIVVLTNGSAIAMPWVDSVPAIVEGWLSGQGFGSAVAKIITGEVNPSGKLSETFPIKIEDTPTFLNIPTDHKLLNYGEGIFVGYRYYLSKGIKTLFPFGHGLSYSSFEYSNLISPKTFYMGENLEINLDIKNTSNVAGSEVVQFYIHKKNSLTSVPARELKGFEKIHLEAGEAKQVSFYISNETFSKFDTEYDKSFIEDGEYTIFIGSSSEDIRLQDSLNLVHDEETSRECILHTSEMSVFADLYRTSKLAEIGDKYFRDILESPIGRLLRGSPLWHVKAFMASDVKVIEQFKRFEVELAELKQQV